MVPSLSLIILAALTPPRFEVSITNDECEEIDYDEKVDLVGISFITPTSNRAYTIADKFRKKGITVVMGGVHASALPEEAIQHCDSVVVGEAESIWPQLLKDFQLGKLKKVYKNNGLIDIDIVPIPRRDLLNKNHYVTTNIIQATRGCPFNCEFCSVSDLFGSKTRFRSVDKVIEEIKTMDDQIIVFADDNLATNVSYMRELFTRMIPLKKHWIGEASWTIANNPDILNIISKSGCKGLLIGFESIRNQDYIKKVSRQKDMKNLYFESIKKLHKKGIIVFGTFIFGFDNDDYDIFPETLDFIIKSKIEFVRLGTLIPFPGTLLYRRLLKEKRIFENDWRNYIYDPPGLCFEPKHIKNQDIRINIKKMYKRVYSLRRILILNLWMFLRYKSISKLRRLYLISLSYRKRIRFEWFKLDINQFDNTIFKEVISNA